MKLIQKTSLLLLFTFLPLISGDFLKQFVKSDGNQKFFIGVVEEKQKLLDELKKELEELLAKYKSEKISQQIGEIDTKQNQVDLQLQKNPDDDFLIKQQLLLKES